MPTQVDPTGVRCVSRDTDPAATRWDRLGTPIGIVPPRVLLDRLLRLTFEAIREPRLTRLLSPKAISHCDFAACGYWLFG